MSLDRSSVMIRRDGEALLPLPLLLRHQEARIRSPGLETEKESEGSFAHDHIRGIIHTGDISRSLEGFRSIRNLMLKRRRV